MIVQKKFKEIGLKDIKLKIMNNKDYEQQYYQNHKCKEKEVNDMFEVYVVADLNMLVDKEKQEVFLNNCNLLVRQHKQIVIHF